MDALSQFMDLSGATCNREMRAWKERGGKIIGYFCPNVPEEIILAAGMLPYRVRAPESRGTTEADRHTTYLNCTYCRHTVDEALLGKYDFLDGFVGTNGCDQMRRVSDIFRAVAFQGAAQQGKLLLEYVAAPRVPFDDASLRYYREELERLKESLESYFGVRITSGKLASAIAQTNRARRLLHELYELRKAEAPPVSGAEALGITVAYTCMPKDLFNERLQSLISALDGRVAVPSYRKRMFLYGSELDDPEWVKVIEDQGALVVADGLCFGARMFWDLVDEAAEPLDALARRYHERWSCPRMVDRERRQERVKQIVRDWKADGIVGERIVFCQLWGSEKVMTNLEAKETGTPTLWLEREYLLGGTGQMKTRVQAFLESME
ncbi:MAG: 2-hydroxyacyl-CoA dehydratase family protein [bacterium]